MKDELRGLVVPAAVAGLLCAVENLALWRVSGVTLPRIGRVALWRERSLDGGPHISPLMRYGLGCTTIGIGLALTGQGATVRAYLAVLAGAGLGTAACYAGHWQGDAAKARRRRAMAHDAAIAARLDTDPLVTAILGKGWVQ